MFWRRRHFSPPFSLKKYIFCISRVGLGGKNLFKTSNTKRNAYSGVAYASLGTKRCTKLARPASKIGILHPLSPQFITYFVDFIDFVSCTIFLKLIRLVVNTGPFIRIAITSVKQLVFAKAKFQNPNRDTVIAFVALNYVVQTGLIFSSLKQQCSSAAGLF